MQRRLTFVALLGTVTFISSVFSQAQMQIYGSWHCGNDFCTWATVRDMTDFDFKNHWLIDRGDGSGLASVNLVILSFVQPMKLLNKTTDSGDTNGVPNAMNAAVVSYFTSHNVTGLQSFVSAYRSQIPYDATGANPAARLTIDLGAGDQYLTDISRYATANFLNDSSPVLDYANAMVPNKQPTSASSAESNWQQHITGKANYAPPVPPLAPARLTGSLYIVTGKNPVSRAGA